MSALPKFTLRDAVRSVQAALGTGSSSSSSASASGRGRGGPSRAGGDGGEEGGGDGGGGGYEPFPRLRLSPHEPGRAGRAGEGEGEGEGGSRGQRQPHQPDQAAVPYDHFPRLSDAQLEKLFPVPAPARAPKAGPGDQTTSSDQERAALRRREVVRAALDEMELNWKLDPLTLGERSEYNQGCAALVALLARVEVASHQPDSALDYSPAAVGASQNDADAQRRQRDAQAGHTGTRTGDPAGVGGPSAFVKRWEAHDVLKAIDQQDHETLLLIRDQAMDLLLDLGSGAGAGRGAGHGVAGGGASASGTGALKTPLGYSISLGPKWDGTSIVICGALSKFVNSLPDGDEEMDAVSKRKRGHKAQLDPRTMQRLRKLKTNLKLAIDSSLFKGETKLLASYMQVLIMSEGVGWVQDSTDSVQRALELHIRGVSVGEGGILAANPVSVANDCVMQFITVNLRSKRDRVTSVNDYIANAVGDLILNALWQMVLLRPSEVAPEARPSHPNDASSSSPASQADFTVPPDLLSPIPPYIFARDERVAQHFTDRVRELRRTLDEVALRAEEEEGRRLSRRARAGSTTSRRSVADRLGEEGQAAQGDGDADDGKDEGAKTAQTRPVSSVIAPSTQRPIQLSRNRNMRFLRAAEHLATELGAAFRISSDRRLELIKQVLKL